MTYTSAKAVRGGLLAAAALLVAGAVPAQATAQEAVPDGRSARTTASGAVPDNWLYLTVTPGEAPSDLGRGTLLLCDPPEGHARAAAACAQLDAADGDIDGIPAKDVSCPMLYAPVTVQARGEWRGRPLAYTRTYPNVCVMAARTGEVFAPVAAT
ncbi:SSI family serine proteinase inhibitor [Streptomyces sp. NPDC052701]|uniref:SSI family serine proteinase inhibitor n=1 Tax=Streptomyces sp. NPDC052701 TaxID=3155533 RepID=UPI00341ABBB2